LSEENRLELSVRWRENAQGDPSSFTTTIRTGSVVSKKSIQRGAKVGLRLTNAERALLLKTLVLISTELEKFIEATPPGKPVLISFDDLDDLAGHVAVEANHTKDKEAQKTLDRISQKIEDLLDKDTVDAESPGPTICSVEHLALSPTGDAPKSSSGRSKSKKGGEQYPLKLTHKQREALVHATRLRRGLKNRIDQGDGMQSIGFTRKELHDLANEVEISLAFVPGSYKKPLVDVQNSINDLLNALEDG
jgi:hypothetical protein